MTNPLLQSTVDERGFAIVSKVIAPQELERLIEGFAQTSLQRSRAGVRHAMRLASVAEIASASPMIGIAREILGEQSKPFRATLFDKSAEANWLVVWHQDTALPFVERIEKPGWGPWSVKDGVIYAHAPAEALQRVIALRLHLDDSGEENGPLRVLPGTHQFGVMDEERIHALASEAKSVDCLVKRGGVLAMWPLVVHASSKSQRDMSRRVLHIECTHSMTVAEDLELAIA